MHADSLVELLSWKPPILPQIIGEGILYPETKMLIYGEYMSWKSMVAMHLAFCMCDGNQWLTHFTTPSRVLIIQTEIPKALYRERVIKYTMHHKVVNMNGIYFVTDLGLRLDSPWGQSAMEDILKKIEPRVCIIDPIYKAMGGDISNSVDVQHTIDTIDTLMNRYKSACILVAHENKGTIDVATGQKYNRGANKIMGSSYWQDWADSICCLTKTGPDRVSVSWEKYRNAQDIINNEEVSIDRKTLGFRANKLTNEEE